MSSNTKKKSAKVILKTLQGQKEKEETYKAFCTFGGFEKKKSGGKA